MILEGSTCIGAALKSNSSIGPSINYVQIFWVFLDHPHLKGQGPNSFLIQSDTLLIDVRISKRNLIPLNLYIIYERSSGLSPKFKVRPAQMLRLNEIFSRLFNYGQNRQTLFNPFSAGVIHMYLFNYRILVTFKLIKKLFLYGMLTGSSLFGDLIWVSY